MPRGGRRPGAGRKRKEVVEHRESTLEERLAAAGRALDLHIKVMDSEKVDLRLRLDAAREVMDRIWGKPTQRQEIEADEPVVIEIIKHGAEDNA